MPKPKNALPFQEIARIVLAAPELSENLLYVKEWVVFFLHNKGRYEMLKTEDFKSRLIPIILRDAPFLSVTPRLLNMLVEYFALVCPKRVDIIDSPYIAFSNQLYNTQTGKFEEFDRDKIAIHFFKFPCSDLEWQSENMPVFKRFLDTTIVEEDGETPDSEAQFLLQEMFGYYMLNDLKGRMTFFLYGEGHNGKSQICELITEMIGRKFCTAMNIEQLTTNRFNTSQLIGKKFNACNEESSKFTDSAIFKTLISGEMITAERKGEDNFSFRPLTKFLFATNLYPTFKGAGKAIFDRIIILTLHADFKRAQKNKKDVHLFKKFMPEIPEIIKWSLDGAKRLIENEYEFSTKFKTALKSMEEYKRENSSAIAFFDETYIIDREAFIANADFYLAYKDWCQFNGRQPLNSVNFYRDINTIDGIQRKIKKINGYLNRGYLIRLKNEKEIAEEEEIEEEPIIPEPQTPVT